MDKELLWLVVMFPLAILILLVIVAFYTGFRIQVPGGPLTNFLSSVFRFLQPV